MKVLMIVLAAALVLPAAQGAPVAIRYTDSAPFKDGKRVEAAWAKADTMTRFVTCRSLDVALDQSEVQALFDEKNLYVSAKGRFDPKQRNDDASLGLFGGDNFELFVKTEGASAYRQVCAGVKEQVYTGIGRVEAKDSGVTCRVQRQWSVDRQCDHTHVVPRRRRAGRDTRRALLRNAPQRLDVWTQARGQLVRADNRLGLWPQ